MGLSLHSFSLSVITQEVTAFSFAEPENPIVLSPLSQLLAEKNLENSENALKFLEDSLENPTIENDFKRFHEGSSGLKLAGIPIIHRVYFHVYRLAKESDASAGGDSWGEIHAFDDLDRLKKAIKATKQELKEACLFEKFKRFESPVAKAKTQSLVAHRLTEENHKALDTFLSVFEMNPSETKRLSLEERLSLIRYESPRFAEYRQRAIKAVIEAENHPLFGQTLGFLTGTTTQAAAGIANRSALVPTGMLLKEHEAPICGEVASGISKRGINQKHLSFVDADYYPTALEYALNQNFVFSKEKSLIELSETMCSFLMQKPSKSSMDLLIALKLRLIRAILFADLPKESISVIKAQITSALSTHGFDEECRHFIENDILPCFETLSSKVLSSKELELIYGKAHPLIFGISTLSDGIADKIKVVRGADIRGETSIEGPLKLGDDIDFIIVADEMLDIIKELFEDKVPYPILSYQAALYLLAKAPRTY